MRVLAIDPGNEHSGWVLLDGMKVLASGDVQNFRITQMIDGVFPASDEHQTIDPHLIAIEFFQSYGMAVGKTSFHTCRWVGRFQEAAARQNIDTQLVYRSDVKMHLCQSMRAKDANVAQAIRDLYPATGGGKKPVIGTKKEPGPLYGVKGHMWQALGVGLTVQYAEKLTEVA